MLTVILHVCSGSLAATRKGHSRARHFGTAFRSWCKIYVACGGHQMNFLSRLGPGSSPGRAESQLASELGELPLLGRRRAVVQQLPWPSAAATATGPMLLAAGELQVQLAGAASILRAPAQRRRRHSGSSRWQCRRRRAGAVVVVCAAAVGRCRLSLLVQLCAHC